MPATPCMIIIFFIPLLVLDSLVATWQYFIISPELYPLNHQGIVDYPTAWKVLVTVGIIVGIAAMVINTVCFAGIWMEIMPKPTRGKRFVRVLILNVVYIALSVFISVACCVAPFIAVDVGWKGNFRNSCDGFEHRVNFDTSSVLFQNLPTSEDFTMTFSPNPEERYSQTYSFYVDPIPSPPQNRSASDFFPSYDSITYDFPTLTYAVMLNSTALLTGSFSFGPTLSVPDLDISADVSTFAKNRVYHPFLKIYDSAGGREFHDKRRKWADNEDVVMRTARFSTTGPLFLCARAQDADPRGLGELSPVVVGLVVLLKGPSPRGERRWILGSGG
jgi:hypothetical protein